MEMDMYETGIKLELRKTVQSNEYVQENDVELFKMAHLTEGCHPSTTFVFDYCQQTKTKHQNDDAK